MAKKKCERGIPLKDARSAGEARVIEAARRAYRLAQKKLHDARDPASSKAAYESVWAATDEVGKAVVESVEGEEAEEDPDSFEDEHQVKWQVVTEDERTYHTLRGPIRVRRKRHRAVRNGPTRCLFEERRGVMTRSTMPDLANNVTAEHVQAALNELA